MQLGSIGLGMTEFGQRYVRIVDELERRAMVYNQTIMYDNLFWTTLERDLISWAKEAAQLIEAFTALLNTSTSKWVTDIFERFKTIRKWQDQKIRSERSSCPKGLNSIFIGNRLQV